MAPRKIKKLKKRTSKAMKQGSLMADCGPEWQAYAKYQDENFIGKTPTTPPTKTKAMPTKPKRITIIPKLTDAKATASKSATSVPPKGTIKSAPLSKG